MAAPGAVLLGTEPLSIAQLVAVADGASLALSPAAERAIAEARQVVEAAIEAGQPVYGLNRRLGDGRDTPIDPQEFAAFQRRTIANHRGGIGRPLDAREARVVVAARAAGFARGGAGVRLELAQAYVDLLNAGIHPAIPQRGSVGAADLTALAEVAAVVTGEGVVVDDDGHTAPAAEALARHGLRPVEFAPHEALAVLSSNAYSIGVGALVATEAASLAAAADRAVALSLEAVGSAGPAGNPGAFSATIADARGGAGQRASAAAVRDALRGSALDDPARPVTVQDPLAFRTAPQIHGALREAVDGTHAELELELAARSENPLVDVDSGRMLSGGNFQALPLALAFEALRLVLAHVASASERRTAALSAALAPSRASGAARLPGLTLYAASAAVAELQQLAAPVTLGFTTLSGVEDHASLAPVALQLAQRSLALTGEVLAIEALHAADLLHASDAVARGHETGPLAATLTSLTAAGLPAAVLVPRALGALRTPAAPQAAGSGDGAA